LAAVYGDGIRFVASTALAAPETIMEVKLISEAWAGVVPKNQYTIATSALVGAAFDVINAQKYIDLVGPEADWIGGLMADVTV
jgi:hypothetical protein